MNRLGGILFSFLLLLLTACGTAEMRVSMVEQKTDREVLSFSLERNTYSMDFKEKDVLLATIRLDYPKLTVVTEDGEAFAAPDDKNIRQVRIAKAFNAAMEAEMAAQKEAFSALCSDAQNHYRSLDEAYKEYWSGYSLAIDCTSFQGENLISTVAAGYWYSGGAHPSSFHQAWNFDLAAGEFVTLEELTEDGDACHRAVADEVARQIYAQGLDRGYFEDFESIVRDLAYTTMSFDDKGMTVRFALYTLAPYAAGVPEFFIDYDVFCAYLNERGREVLPVPQEDYVLASFYETQELWSYFHMSTIPLDYGAHAIGQDGMTYFRVNYKGITTLAELKDHLCLYVTEEIAEEWLAYTPNRFIEIDGVLYCFEADRGSDLRYGNPRYEVDLLGENGTVTETLDEYDTEKIDEQTGEMPVIGEQTITYPFALVDGRAIFEHFDCVW